MPFYEWYGRTLAELTKLPLDLTPAELLHLLAFWDQFGMRQDQVRYALKSVLENDGAGEFSFYDKPLWFGMADPSVNKLPNDLASHNLRVGGRTIVRFLAREFGTRMFVADIEKSAFSFSAQCRGVVPVVFDILHLLFGEIVVSDNYDSDPSGIASIKVSLLNLRLWHYEVEQVLARELYRRGIATREFLFKGSMQREEIPVDCVDSLKANAAITQLTIELEAELEQLDTVSATDKCGEISPDPRLPNVRMFEGVIEYLGTPYGESDTDVLRLFDALVKTPGHRIYCNKLDPPILKPYRVIEKIEHRVLRNLVKSDGTKGTYLDLPPAA